MKSDGKHYKVYDNNDDIVDRFIHLFINRTDTYAFQREDGSYVRVDAPLNKDVLRRHFIGETTVGAYLVNPEDQTTKTLCFDVDPERVDNPKDTASKILKACSGRFPGKAVLLEASRHPDPSYHVWVFFEPPIPAKAARYLGRKILEHAGVVVELFPKQDAVVPGEFGNLVKLPLGLHRKVAKWSCFLDPATFTPLNPTCLFRVQGCTFSEADIEQAMKLADEERHVQVKLATTRTAALKEVEDLSKIPCVRAFRDHPIQPGSRHVTAAKNLAILYWQAKGTWEGFEAWAEELAENKPDFTARKITDWKSWVEQEQRELNCAELRGFMKAYVEDFSCEGCPIKAAEAEAGKPISIPHLNMVEDPQHAGKALTVEAVVASTSVAYLVPKEVEATVEIEENNSKKF